MAIVRIAIRTKYPQTDVGERLQRVAPSAATTPEPEVDELIIAEVASATDEAVQDYVKMIDAILLGYEFPSPQVEDIAFEQAARNMLNKVTAKGHNKGAVWFNLLNERDYFTVNQIAFVAKLLGYQKYWVYCKALELVSEERLLDEENAIAFKQWKGESGE